jgi:hypothetical protein
VRRTPDNGRTFVWPPSTLSDDKMPFTNNIEKKRRFGLETRTAQ